MRISLHKLRGNEDGLTAIMVTTIMIAIISLLVIGFSLTTRNNVTQTLNRELSAQALYAAESGINDARNGIANALKNGTPITARNSCTAVDLYSTSGSVDATHDVSYSCLLVNPVPTSLVFNYQSGGGGQVFPIDVSDISNGAAPAIKTLRLQWTGNGGSALSSCPSGVSGAGTGNFPAAGSWACPFPILRVDFVPTLGAAIDRQALTASDMVDFIVPTNGGGDSAPAYQTAATNAYGANVNQGAVTSADCVALSLICTATIRINTAAAVQKGYMRILPIYATGNGSVTVTAFNQDPIGGLSKQYGLANAQALVDSTGKATDVLRRVQVRLPLSTSGDNTSNYALQSDCSIYKNFGGFPSAGSIASSPSTSFVPPSCT